LPKQNRPLVRDGRIQARKRTDRSYLRPNAAPADTAPTDSVADAPGAESFEEPDAVAEILASAAPAVAAATAAIPGRLPASVRAIQQQGVRKRRDIDLNLLAVSDTKYALHELRRIAVLAAMVIVTLIVLGAVLR
jgi:hypothetical protein